MSKNDEIAKAARINKYEWFINNVLREDLRRLEQNLQQVNAEITDLIQQKQTIKVVNNKEIHPDGFKAKINIGSNFFMEASVPDPSMLLMNIGKDHYLEFDVKEADKYLDARIEAFERQAVEIKAKAADVKAHIKIMFMHLNNLTNLVENQH